MPIPILQFQPFHLYSFVFYLLCSPHAHINADIRCRIATTAATVRRVVHWTIIAADNLVKNTSKISIRTRSSGQPPAPTSLATLSYTWMLQLCPATILFGAAIIPCSFTYKFIFDFDACKIFSSSLSFCYFFCFNFEIKNY